MLLHSIISEMDIFYEDKGNCGEFPQLCQRRFRHGVAGFVKDNDGERMYDFFSTDPRDYLNKKW